MIVFLNPEWADRSDDEVVHQVARKLIEDIEADAKSLGEYDNFIYLNYAAPWQDPLGGYGKENLARLRKVRDDVDPGRVFTRQVPGGFKIPV
jgi:FAD/FMN-containing dehydrogenase